MTSNPRLALREWHLEGFTISTDTARLDLDAIHGFLQGSYWSQGIPRQVVARSIEASLNFGLFEGSRQAGFARVVSDYATFAWLGDVFVLERYRGRGLSKWLMECVMAHPALQGLRRFMLATRDAHGLYAQFGFAPPANPATIMQILDLDIYHRDREAN